MWIPIDNEPFSNTNYDNFKTFVKTSALPVQVSTKKKDPINENIARYCEELFHSYDHDKDGMLSRGEFADLLDLGLLLRDKIDDFDIFCQNAFDCHDIQQRDVISFEEFLTFYEALKRRMPTQIPKVAESERAERGEMNEMIISAAKVEKIAQQEFELLRLDEKAMMRIFKLFDKDNSGCLDTDEIKHIITQIGIPDYERDGYVGFIKRSTQMLMDEDVATTIKFSEFRRLLESLSTAKVDRAYRQFILQRH